LSFDVFIIGAGGGEKRGHGQKNLARKRELAAKEKKVGLLIFGVGRGS